MIFNNKKAQNITKPYTIILIMVIVGIFSTMIFQFGQDLASDPNNKLNAESVSYIYNKSGYTPSNTITPDDSTDLFFSSDLNTSGNTKDFALEFEFYREQSSSIRTIIQDLWNLPSFFVDGLTLDANDWGIVIAMWNTIIWLLIFYAIYRIVRGLL